MHVSFPPKKPKKNKIDSKVIAKFEQWKQKPPIIIRFLDPYQHYYLYGDMVLPNKIWQSKSETIYPIDLHRNYKIIRQIHFRQHGIVFELDELDENMMTSIDFLQNRLRSLGNQNSHDLADFLDYYQEFFKKDQINEMPPEMVSNDKLEQNVFDWMDEIFKLNQENIIFLKGNKFTKNNRDFRVKYLGYNFKLLEWLTNEDNIFSEEFIRNCFRFVFVKNLEGFMAILKTIVTKKNKDSVKTTIISRSLNTIIGTINLLMKFDTFAFPKQRIIFQYAVHSKEDFDPIIEKKIISKKMEVYSKKMKYDFCRKESRTYAGLMKFYYVNKK